MLSDKHCPVTLTLNVKSLPQSQPNVSGGNYASTGRSGRQVISKIVWDSSKRADFNNALDSCNLADLQNLLDSLKGNEVSQSDIDKVASSIYKRCMLMLPLRLICFLKPLLLALR